MSGKPRVLAAMSGGVDSSVVAALLRREGYEVIGVTMQVWPDPPPGTGAEYGGCCSLDAVDDARAVAYRLGIPYYVLNMRDVFADKVIAYFIEEYTRGRTPNPCVMCNHHVKFDALLAKALALECDYVATGHYARVGWDGDRRRYVIRKGVDPRKDQSYALFGLTQAQLRHVLMPLGEFTKDETRALAAELDLPVAQKPDSQEICFVLNNDYRSFLATEAPDAIRPGPILDTRGRRLGTHQGLPFYTVGQRRGLGISSSEPLYVVELDPATNTLVVGTAAELGAAELVASDLNWVSVAGIEGPVRARVRIRYRGAEVPATIRPVGPEGSGRVRVRFEEPQRAATPGQMAVFYDGDLLLGGGIIESRAR